MTRAVTSFSAAWVRRSQIAERPIGEEPSGPRGPAIEQGQRHEPFDLRALVQTVESARRHPDDPGRNAIDPDDRANDRGVAAEAPLPELVGEHHDGLAPFMLAFARLERTAQPGRQLQP